MKRRSYWLALAIGGNFYDDAHGSGWTPSIWRRLWLFYSQSWYRVTTLRRYLTPPRMNPSGPWPGYKGRA